MAEKKEPVIKLENVSFVYGAGMPGEMRALNNINLEINEGEFIGLIGHTGCGKSTLISHFNGLNKPTEGTVLVDGQDIWQKKEELQRYRFKVGLVFQYPEYQLFEETVYKDMCYGPKNMGLPQEEIDKNVREACGFCGVEESWFEKSPFELSGGQKRRVAIAGVMAMRPEVLVLDEPAAGLDPAGRIAILEQMKRYHKESGKTVVLVSHSMEDIARYAEKVLVLEKGEIAMFAPTNEVFAQTDKLAGMGLSVPQITQIFIKLKEMGLPIGSDVYTMNYAVEQLVRYRDEKRKEGAQ